MRSYLRYDSQKPGNFIVTTMVIFSLLMIGFGFLQDSPGEVFAGIARIVRTPAGLITDSITVGGMGGAFVNAGLVTLISITLLRLVKLHFTGISVACVFLMAGFALFGKDICNIFPIITGGFLYSVYKRERFSKYIHMSLFGTALAPMVTEMASIAGNRSVLFRLVMVIGVGILIGFILPPIASYTLRVHQGYNLYNVGFTAGLIGMVLASVAKSFGYEFSSRFEWSTGNNTQLMTFLFLLFAVFIFVGFWYNGRSFRGAARILRHSGRSVADFVILDGYPVTLINMGVMGISSTAYVLMVGGALNGPTVGGILAISGFGAFGKHLRNCVPVVLGVVLSSFPMVWSLSDPNVLLAALFATGLAPVAGQFGWKWGILTGVIHASVVLNVGILHAGLNLYNNGFSAGLICIVMIPLIEALRKEGNE